MKPNLLTVLCVAIALAGCNSQPTPQIATIQIEPQDTVVKLSDIFDLCYVIPLNNGGRDVAKVMTSIGTDCLIAEKNSYTLRLVDWTGKEINALTLELNDKVSTDLVDFWYDFDNNPDRIVDVLVQIFDNDSSTNKMEIRCYKLPDFAECGRTVLPAETRTIEALCRVNASDYLLGSSWWSNGTMRLKRWDATLSALKDEYIPPRPLPIIFTEDNRTRPITETRNMFLRSGFGYIMSQTYDQMVYKLDEKGIPADSLWLDFGDRKITYQSEVYPFGSNMSLDYGKSANREIRFSFNECMLFDYDYGGRRYMAVTDGNGSSQSFTHIYDDLVLGDTLRVDMFRPLYAGALMVLSVSGETVREAIEHNCIATSDKETQRQLNAVGSDDNLLFVLTGKQTSENQ